MNRTENKLGTMPVGKLLVSMSLPMMISFFIQALYNIVDSMFVAQISENALTAVSLAFPMQQIMHALSVGLGVGINASVPRYLGQGDHDRAERTAGTGLFLNIVFIAVFMILGVVASHAIYTMQTNVQEIVDYGTTYLRICWLVCLGEFFGQYFEKLLVCTGRPTMAMTAQATGAIFNIIFDPLLIFGIGPFPKMGIAGAATATVLGQVLGAGVAFVLNMKKNTSVSIHLKYIRPEAKAVKDMLAVGFPSMVTIGLSSVTTFSINQILLGYSTTATAVYGIWMKLQNFCFMPVFGMNNGMVPILSYNYATKNHQRVNRAVNLALKAMVTYLVVLAVVLEFIPGPLLRMFNASENMMEIGKIAVRTTILSLPLGGASIILTSCMQAMLHARFALTVNILRQFVLIVGLFAGLSALTHQLSMLWIAVPLTEALGLLAAVLLTRKMRRDLWGE